MANVFEQLPKESAKAFEAFSVYLNMGPERSLGAVGQKLGKSRGLLERWSAKFDWAGRVQAQAAYLAVVEREATEAVARGRSAVWVKRQQEIREREWEMHEKCIAAAKRGLAAFMEREKVYANLADISRMLEVASKLGRLATGMATDKTEVTGEDGGAIRVELEAALKKVYGDLAVRPPAEPGHGVVDVEAMPVESCRLEVGGSGRASAFGEAGAEKSAGQCPASPEATARQGGGQ